jgi:hypothetical protein
MTIEYNGVVFDARSRSQIQSRPVYNEAGNSCVYMQHTLTVDGWVTGLKPNTTDTMTNMLTRLSKPGGELIYYEEGWQDVEVNTPGGGGVRDVKWGPHPEVLSFRPLGGNGNAAAVSFRVVFCIPHCDDAVYETDNGTNVLMALDWTCTFEISDLGLTTQRYTGYMEVPMTRDDVDERTVRDCVDRYRERLQNRLPPNRYRRHSQVYTPSYDRRRLDFAWVDEQVPSSIPLPDHAARIDARQHARTVDKGPMKLWLVTISATIHVPMGTAKAKTLDIFLQLLNDRAANFFFSQARRPFLPVHFEVDDNIFGTEVRYSCVLRDLVQRDLSQMLRSYRFWQTVGTAADGTWRATMLVAPSKAWSVRGNSGLEMEAGETALVDLCVATSKESPGKSPAADPVASPAAANVPKGGTNAPAPDETWINYDATIRYKESSNTVMHKPLPSQPQAGYRFPPPPSIGPGITSSAGAASTTRAAPPTPPQGPTVPDATAAASVLAAAVGAAGAAQAQGNLPHDAIQRTTAPSRTVELLGYGTRLGYRVPVPRLMSVGGITAVEEERDVVVDRVIATFGDTPVYETMWRITYTVPAAPAYLPTLSNPLLESDATAGPGGF